MKLSQSPIRSVIARAHLLQPGDRPGASVLKLNSNENPYLPSPQTIAALRGIRGDDLRRYPRTDDFCRAVSQVLQVPADWILATNGADALLDYLIRACAEGRDRPVVMPTPTYPLYAHLAQLQPANVIAIPYEQTESVDAARLNTSNAPLLRLPIAAIAAANGAVTLIANPNSPTGHVTEIASLRTLAAQLDGILAIDEAYVDFREPDAVSALELVREYPNVIVLRTLSKGYALAGLRLGFGVAQPVLLHELAKLKPVYDLDAIAVQVGAAAIHDQAYKEARAAAIRHTREQFSGALRDRGFTVWPSGGNFVLVQPPDTQGTARSLHNALRSRQIWTRYYPELPNRLRITIGTAVQMQQVLAAIDALAEKLHQSHPISDPIFPR